MLRPGALGDTLLAVPALRALRHAYAPLRLAAHAGAARLLEVLGEVDSGMPFDDPSLTPLFSNDWIPMEPIVAWMSATPALRHAAVVAPSRPAGTEHAARYLLRTLEPLRIDLAWDDSPLRVQPIVSDEVLVHVGSGSAAKNWPAARFAEVIRTLDSRVRLIVGEADLSATTALEEELGYAPPRLDHLPLEELAARLAGCRAYVGNDSGVSHLAALSGARTVVLFGPSDPKIWRPIGPDVHVRPFDVDSHDVVTLLDSRRP